MLYVHVQQNGVTDMQMIFKAGKVEIWAVSEAWGTDYWVYGVTLSGDPRVCPSLGTAREIAAS